MQHPWASEGFFQGSANRGFSRGSPEDFSRGGESGEILFYRLETKMTSVFAKNLIG